VIGVLGPQGAQAYKTISPLDIQGDFDVMIDVTSDSLMRQERRAEAQALLQIAAQVAPIFATSGAPLNMKPFMEKALDAYDIPDKDRYFLPVTPPGLAAQAQPGQPQLQAPGGAPAPPPQGITNPGAAAGPSSPSNGTSLSPEAAMQRMLAMQGGTANAAS
jgi:hypothetical protein